MFDTGYDITATWIGSRTDHELLSIVDPHVLGLPAETAAAARIQSIA